MYMDMHLYTYIYSSDHVLALAHAFLFDTLRKKVHNERENLYKSLRELYNKKYEKK